ncbi:hypothetical protein GN956_G10010 [Arapaima gigas]
MVVSMESTYDWVVCFFHRRDSLPVPALQASAAGPQLAAQASVPNAVKLCSSSNASLVQSSRQSRRGILSACSAVGWTLTTKEGGAERVRENERERGRRKRKLEREPEGARQAPDNGIYTESQDKEKACRFCEALVVGQRERLKDNKRWASRPFGGESAGGRSSCAGSPHKLSSREALQREVCDPLLLSQTREDRARQERKKEAKKRSGVLQIEEDRCLKEARLCTSLPSTGKQAVEKIAATMKGDSEESIESLRPSNLQAFANNSTLHGMSHIFAYGHMTFRRFLWTLSFLGSLGLLLLVCMDRISYYLEYPHVTKLDEVAAPNLTFPAVTFCNLNEFRFSKITRNDLYHVGELLALLNENYQIANPHLAEPEVLAALRDKANFLNFKPKQFNMTDFYNRTGHDISDMLLQCTFRGEDCYPLNFTTVSFCALFLNFLVFCFSRLYAFYFLCQQTGEKA